MPRNCAQSSRRQQHPMFCVINKILYFLLQMALVVFIVGTVMYLLPAIIAWIRENQANLAITEGRLDIALAGHRLLLDYEILSLCADKLSALINITCRLIPEPIQTFAASIWHCIARAFLALHT